MRKSSTTGDIYMNIRISFRRTFILTIITLYGATIVSSQAARQPMQLLLSPTPS